MRKFCKMIGALTVLVSVTLSSLAAQPAAEVRGTVTDGDSGRPLAGVSVALSGSATSTTTDAKGAYAIRVPSAAAVLEFSREGYLARKVPTEGRTQVDVALKPAPRETGVVKGIVTDSDNGAPLAGVTVVISGSARGTTTDAKGAYTLSVPSAESVLDFSYLGYVPQKIRVGNRSQVDISLVADNKDIDEVVVIGYSEVKKTDLTGSVTNVKMGDIKDIPVVSVDQALQGRVAGADIMSTSGDPTASTSIRIRGTRSITASNEPLIVVDGIIDAVQDLSDINSADIESISVLKDASSTAIYGARGSNGVIIVTTRKGNPTVSKPWITLKADMGFSQLPRNLDVMNATEFALYRNDVTYFNWQMGNRPVQDYTYNDPYSLGKGTNWIDEITRTAPYQNYNLSVSGRSKTSSYFVSLGYSDIQGIVDDSGFQRTTARVNVSHDFAKWFTAGVNSSLSYRDEANNKANIGGSSVWNAATYLAPVLGPEDTYNPFYGSGQTINNPRYTINLNENTLERFASTNTLYVDIKPIEGLKISSKFTYYLYQRHDYRFYPSTLPVKNEGEGGEGYRAEYDTRTLSTENTVTYAYTAKTGHYFDVMGGFTGSKSRLNGFDLNAKGLIVDDNKWNNMNGIYDKENYTSTSYTNYITKMSVLARVNYNYKKRYYLTLTGRYDGSSNFAANHKWGFFPSAAVKWNISNEYFMRRVRWIEELSLRVSAGRTGNDAIKPYRSIEAYTSTSGGYLLGGSQSTAFYPVRVASDNLTWETTDLYNAAIDASLFKKRLNITFEAYISKTRDLLLSVQKAAQSGYTSHFENIGRTSNKGVELTVETRNIVKPKFSWSTSLTLSHNKQMVEDIGSEDFVSAMNSPGNSQYMMYGYVKGRPLNALWGFKYGGVWHNQEEIERNKVTNTYVSATTSLSPGLPRYIDTNNDGSLDQKDLVYLGNADPTIYGGLQNTFNIGQLKVGVYFAYSLGGKIYNYSELYMAGTYSSNQYRYMANSWHPVRNPDSNLPRAGAVQVHVPSDLQVHDASYLRLKNVSVGYTFDLRKRVKWLRDITLSVSGENLYLWSKYNGFDPDVSTSSESSTLRRVDMGAYPRARTVIFSVQIRY